MRSLTNTVAALLMAAPIAVALPAFAQESEERSGPVILDLNGGEVERGGDVKVIRGSAEPLVYANRNLSSKVIPRGDIDLVGGDTLWLVDRKAGILTGCFLAATIVAGDLRDIRCENARLR